MYRYCTTKQCWPTCGILVIFKVWFYLKLSLPKLSFLHSFFKRITTSPPYVSSQTSYRMLRPTTRAPTWTWWRRPPRRTAGRTWCATSRWRARRRVTLTSSPSWSLPTPRPPALQTWVSYINLNNFFYCPSICPEKRCSLIMVLSKWSSQTIPFLLPMFFCKIKFMFRGVCVQSQPRRRWQDWRSLLRRR